MASSQPQGDGLIVGINVTPMVDIMLVLLIIFTSPRDLVTPRPRTCPRTPDRAGPGRLSVMSRPRCHPRRGEPPHPSELTASPPTTARDPQLRDVIQPTAASPTAASSRPRRAQARRPRARRLRPPTHTPPRRSAPPRRGSEAPVTATTGPGTCSSRQAPRRIVDMFSTTRPRGRAPAAIASPASRTSASLPGRRRAGKPRGGAPTSRRIHDDADPRRDRRQRHTPEPPPPETTSARRTTHRRPPPTAHGPAHPHGRAAPAQAAGRDRGRRPHSPRRLVQGQAPPRRRRTTPPSPPPTAGAQRRRAPPTPPATSDPTTQRAAPAHALGQWSCRDRTEEPVYDRRATATIRVTVAPTATSSRAPCPRSRRRLRGRGELSAPARPAPRHRRQGRPIRAAHRVSVHFYRGPRATAKPRFPHPAPPSSPCSRCAAARRTASAQECRRSEPHRRLGLRGRLPRSTLTQHKQEPRAPLRRELVAARAGACRRAPASGRPGPPRRSAEGLH